MVTPWTADERIVDTDLNLRLEEINALAEAGDYSPYRILKPSTLIANGTVTVSIDDIPQTNYMLIVDLLLRTPTAIPAGYAFMKFNNNDPTLCMRFFYENETSSTLNSSISIHTTQDSLTPANSLAVTQFYLTNYTSSILPKAFYIRDGRVAGGRAKRGGGVRDDLNPITSIQIQADGQFVGNSRYAVYGVGSPLA